MKAKKISFFIKESFAFISYLLVGAFSCGLAFFIVVQFLNPALSENQRKDQVFLAQNEPKKVKEIFKDVKEGFVDIMKNTFGDGSKKEDKPSQAKETNRFVAPAEPSGQAPLPGAVPAEPSGQAPPPGAVPAEPSGQAPPPGAVPAEPSGQAPPPGAVPAEPSGQAPPPGEIPAEPSGQAPPPGAVPAEPSGQAPPPGAVPAEPSGQAPPPGAVPAEPSGQAPPPGEIPAEPSGQAPPPGAVPAEPSGQAPPPGAVPAEPSGQAPPPGDVPKESQNHVLELETFMSPFIYDPERRRDPFEDPTALRAAENIIVVPKTPPEEYDLSQIKLKGIIWDVKSPKALFQLPGQGGFYTLLRGDKVGKNGTLFEIREDEVVIVETILKVAGTSQVKETEIKIIKLDRLNRR